MADSHRRPEEIEREIAETRMHADRQLTEIEERLSPNHLVQEAFDYLRRDSGGQRLFGDIVETIIKNPLPTTLMALGAGWLVANGYRTRSSTASTDRRSTSPMLAAAQEHHVHLGEGSASAHEGGAPSANEIIGRTPSDHPAAESARAFEEETARAEPRRPEPSSGFVAGTAGTSAVGGAGTIGGKPEEETWSEVSKTQTERLRDEARRRAAETPRPEAHRYHVPPTDPTKPEGASPASEEASRIRHGNKSAKESAGVFEKKQSRKGERPRAP